MAISRYHNLQEIFSSLGPSCNEALHFVNTLERAKKRVEINNK